MKIWANTIVNNEENFIWFAIMSVIDYVDKILIWDNGSSDRTVEIIRKIIEIKGDKVDFRQIGEVTGNDFPKVRQAMLEQSPCDWVLILDGDEIWWEPSIINLRKTIDKKGNVIDGVVVPMMVPVGDIYHMQDETAGRYELLGRKGHLSLRAIRKIVGLHVDWPYGKETYLDENNLPVQERKSIIFLDAPYLHVTHLRRSSERNKLDKFKYEIGKLPQKDFKYPEIFYKKRPNFIPSPWNKISGKELIKASLLTPLRRIKRKILS